MARLYRLAGVDPLVAGTFHGLRAGRIRAAREQALESRTNRRQGRTLLGNGLALSRGQITVLDDPAASANLKRHIEAVLWSDLVPDSPFLQPVALPRQGRRPLLVQAQALRGVVRDYFAQARRF